MQRAIRLSKRAERAVFAVLAAAFAAALGVVSCVTASPPNVTQPPLFGPIILTDLVQPPSNAPLTALPEAGFVVPVRVSNPNQSVTCKVFVDFSPGNDDNQHATNAAMSCTPTLPALGDGGSAVLSFVLTADNIGDPTACHFIQCFVADSFLQNTAHAPGDSLGATSVWWQYAPNGLGGCDTVDAGDGAFPPEAGGVSDALPLVPDAVGPL
jgi:hypothetical protein